MKEERKIHSVPIEKYKLAYNLLQGFIGDFEFNEEQPEDKIKIVHLIYLTAKYLEEKKIDKMMKEKNITDDDVNKYFHKLMEESLI